MGAKRAEGAMTLAEMKEFASFPAATQRYIRRSLDIGLDRDDAMARWSRDVVEAASIRRRRGCTAGCRRCARWCPTMPISHSSNRSSRRW